MQGVLSLPFLLVLAWGLAALLWWDRRRKVIASRQVPWTMAAMALVTIAMALLLAFQSAPWGEQLVRVALLAVGMYGFGTLAKRSARK